MGETGLSPAITEVDKHTQKAPLSGRGDAGEWQEVTPTGLEPVLPP